MHDLHKKLIKIHCHYNSPWIMYVSEKSGIRKGCVMKFRIPILFVVIIFNFIIAAQAKVEVLFHPYDPTLEKIAEVFQGAQSRIDIAMYNLETTSKSPIIEMLGSVEMQNKIRNGKLKIRMIFEGYGTPEENSSNMKRLEDIGIDVRALNSSKKIHHKFAVIDANTSHSQLISGSANWSLSSRANYNENIFFIESETEITKQFQNEFELLWANSKEFGLSLNHPSLQFRKVLPSESLLGHFNSLNYDFTAEGVVLKKNNPMVLTDLLVQQIAQAESEILIATTRIHLEPIKEALLEALSRKVKVWIVVSMDEYPSRHSAIRDLEAAGAQVRIKYYNLVKSEYLRRQMHNKYMIVDQNRVLSGSFNWSISAENSHIENIIQVDRSDYPEAVEAFIHDYQRLWVLNRDQFKSTLQKITSTDDLKCDLNPMVLYRSEINSLLKAFKGKSCH